jgi:predicted RNA binding protein YcfA (HicA-like mRNA interferase family)
MISVPNLTGKELLSVLKKAGFELLHIKGSHHFLLHPDGCSTVVPSVTIHSKSVKQRYASLCPEIRPIFGVYLQLHEG